MAADADSKLGGVVLCRAGGHRLAFPASQVAVIEVWSEGGRPIPNAREAYALPTQPGRLLLSDTGDGVVVDTLEVATESADLLPSPRVLVGGAGGSLRGFLSARDQLWPVLQLADFSLYLAGLEPSGAGR